MTGRGTYDHCRGLGAWLRISDEGSNQEKARVSLVKTYVKNRWVGKRTVPVRCVQGMTPVNLLRLSIVSRSS